MSRDAWDPERYERFRRERTQPFHDLLALVEPEPHLRVVDLGCGTGELTRLLHERLGAVDTLGLDTSPAMLARAPSASGLTFEEGDLRALDVESSFDLVFSNAALQWVDDHAAVLERITAALAPGGQLAIQMPANHDHVSHRIAHEVAEEPQFAAALNGYVRTSPVLAPEEYARLLYRLGFERQHVRLQVYVHELPGYASIVEWVQGTLLTDYESRLPRALYGAFVERYREALHAAVGDDEPMFYPFKRLHLWARLPRASA